MKRIATFLFLLLAFPVSIGWSGWLAPGTKYNPKTQRYYSTGGWWPGSAGFWNFNPLLYYGPDDPPIWANGGRGKIKIVDGPNPPPPPPNPPPPPPPPCFGCGRGSKVVK